MGNLHIHLMIYLLECRSTKDLWCLLSPWARTNWIIELIYGGALCFDPECKEWYHLSGITQKTGLKDPCRYHTKRMLGWHQTSHTLFDLDTTLSKLFFWYDCNVGTLVRVHTCPYEQWLSVDMSGECNSLLFYESVHFHCMPLIWCECFLCSVKQSMKCEAAWWKIRPLQKRDAEIRASLNHPI